jgi:hypothetical protein
VSEASACVEENLGKRLHHHVSLSIDRDGGTITIGRSNKLETATRGTEKRLIASILVVDVADRFPAVVNTLGGPPQQPPKDRIVLPIHKSGPVVVFPGSRDSPATSSVSLMLWA